MSSTMSTRRVSATSPITATTLCSLISIMPKNYKTKLRSRIPLSPSLFWKKSKLRTLKALLLGNSWCMPIRVFFPSKRSVGCTRKGKKGKSDSFMRLPVGKDWFSCLTWSMSTTFMFSPKRYWISSGAQINQGRNWRWLLRPSTQAPNSSKSMSGWAWTFSSAE